MNPTLEQLARYVSQELERGVPESTLHTALRETGWTPEWINAAFSAARQRAVPAMVPQLEMLAVQQQAVTSTRRSVPVVETVQSQPVQPLVKPYRPQPSQRRASPTSMAGIRNALLITIAVLSSVVIGLGAYRVIEGLQQAAQQKVVRDADRREDLSVMLSDLSDYFVAHGSYPTRTQMNTTSFLKANNFAAASVIDPKWSIQDKACTTEGRPILAGNATHNCYVYKVTAAKDAVCNNAKTPCTRVKVSIWLEVDKKTYDVTFDKNTQVDL